MDSNLAEIIRQSREDNTDAEIRRDGATQGGDNRGNDVMERIIRQSREDNPDDKTREEIGALSEEEARERGITDRETQAEFEQFKRLTGDKNATFRDYRNSNPELFPDNIPDGARLKELDYSGRPTVFEQNGEEYFTKYSTSYNLGFRTASEVKEAQRYGSQYGIHSGDDVPEVSYIPIGDDGRPLGIRIAASELTGDKSGYLQNGKYRVAIRDNGKEIQVNPDAVEDVVSGINRDRRIKAEAEIARIEGEQAKAPYNALRSYVASSIAGYLNAMQAIQPVFEDRVKEIGYASGVTILDALNRKGLNQYKEFADAIKDTDEGKYMAIPQYVIDHATPFYRTIKHWDELTPGWRAVNLAIDTIIVAPLVAKSIQAIDKAIYPTRYMDGVDAILKAENKYTTQMANMIAREYGDDVARSFKDMQLAQSDFARAYARYQDALRNKVTDVGRLLDSVDDAQSKLTETARLYSSKMGGVLMSESGTGLQSLPYMTANSILKEMPNDLPRNWKSIIDSLGGNKENVRALETALNASKARYDAVKLQFPTKPEKWVSAYTDMVNNQSLLNAARSRTIQDVLQQIDDTDSLIKAANLNREYLDVAKYEAQMRGLKSELAQVVATIGTETKVITVNEGGKIVYKIAPDWSLGTTITRTVKPPITLTSKDIDRLNALLKRAGATSTLPYFATAVTGGGGKSYELNKPASSEVLADAVSTKQILPLISGKTMPLTIPEIVTFPEVRTIFDSPEVTTHPEIKTAIAEAVRIDLGDLYNPSTGVGRDISGVSERQTQGVPQDKVMSNLQPSSVPIGQVKPGLASSPRPQMSPQPQPSISPNIQTPTPIKTSVKIPVAPFLAWDKGMGALSIRDIPKGTITWRQGLKWVAFFPPYNDPDDKIYLDNPLPGTTKFATGKGSAYATLQVLNGKPPEIETLDMGWATVNFKQEGNNFRMSFDGGDDAIRERWNKERSSMDIVSRMGYENKPQQPIIRHVERHNNRRTSRLDLGGNSTDDLRIMTNPVNYRLNLPSKPVKPLQRGYSDRYYLGRKLRPVNLDMEL